MTLDKLPKRVVGPTLRVTENFVTNEHWAIRKSILGPKLAPIFATQDVALAVYKAEVGLPSSADADGLIAKFFSAPETARPFRRTQVLLESSRDGRLMRLFAHERETVWYDEKYVKAFDLWTLFVDDPNRHAWDSLEAPDLTLMPLAPSAADTSDLDAVFGG